MDMFYSFTPVLSPKYLTLNLLATLMVIYQSSGWVQGQIFRTNLSSVHQSLTNLFDWHSLNNVTSFHLQLLCDIYSVGTVF